VRRELRQHAPDGVEGTMSEISDGTPDYARTFVDGLKEAGVGLVTALPESLLKSVYRLCAEDPDIRYIPVTNEGELPGICAGAYVVGARALMIMENSGIRQASEPIARFSFRSAIPMVMVLSYRGDFGERNFWGHNHAQTMEPMLNALRIPFRYVRRVDQIKPAFVRAFAHADASQWPAALVFSGDCVEGVDYAAD